MPSSQRDTRVAADAAAAYRADFLRVVSRVGLDAHRAACLAEAVSGRRFQACGPAELVPALAHLAALAERVRAAHCPGDQACDE